MGSQSGRKDRLRQLKPEGKLAFQCEEAKPLYAAYGLVPLAVPYEDAPAELRILNAISAGLLFEGREGNADELGISRQEFARTLRSLRTCGAVRVGPSGIFKLGFSTSNFPNVTLR